MIIPEKPVKGSMPIDINKTSLDSITVHGKNKANGTAYGSTKRSHARSLSKTLTQKAKRKLSLSQSHHGQSNSLESLDKNGLKSSQHMTLESKVSHDPAFNPAHVLSHPPPPLGKHQGDVKDDLKSIATAIVHPVESVKSRATRTAAGKMSKVQRPFLSPEEDRQFLSKHEELSRVASPRSSWAQQSGEEQDQEEAALRIQLEDLEDHRSSLEAAWNLGRHVDRVRVVRNKVPNFPVKASFEERDEKGNVVRRKWEKYVGYVRLP